MYQLQDPKPVSCADIFTHKIKIKITTMGL